MRKKPFFSVIVPAHNSADFIRKGLDSIKEQSFTDHQLIVVCDACTDKTAEVMSEYLYSPGDTALFTDYGKAGMARNAGLNIADGEWILFMDDDDWYLPGAFQAIYDHLQFEKDIDVLAYGFDWKDVGQLFQSPVRVYPAVWNKAWRREFIGKERFPDWIHTDDLGFARKMHPKARFGFIQKSLYYYNFMRPGSVSARIRAGEYDNSTQLPPEARQAADGYERWLREKF